jgi:hypothetical protein
MELPELPVGYYRDNFLLLLDHGDSLYKDLLGDEDRAFSSAFRGCSLPAQRLYVRLVSRKGPLFRSDRLHYDEIGDVSAPGAELEAAGLLAVDRPGDLEAAIALLRRDELLDVLAAEGCERPSPPARRAGLVEQCMAAVPPGRLLASLLLRFHIYEPPGLEAISTYRLLFFGNRWQDLTELVLSDLGLVRYEAYRIAPEDRLFSSPAGLQNARLVLDLASRCDEAAASADLDALRGIATALPLVKTGEPAAETRNDILVTVGRHLERAGDLPGAMAIYRQAETPSSRQRQARVLQRLGQLEEALALCRRMLDEPADEEELQFDAGFAPRLERKLHGRPRHEEQPARPAAEVLPLSWADDAAVEDAVLEHYRGLGWEGYHTENELWNGLFGLAFWDIVFMPVRGVFYHRFQRGPQDLFTPRFRPARSDAIEQRLAEIRDSDAWVERLRDTWDRCLGIANALVAWDRLPPGLVESALARIPRETLALVFDRMAANLGLNRAGFPDLVLFPPGGGAGFDLVEVKGPGDQLRPNQERWLRFFDRHAIPARVIRVERADP